jgi:phosphoribosyl 1,2-cyclic phosphodiesterase
MKIKFWGTRGSLPAPLTARQVRDKVVQALAATRGHTLPTDETQLGAWVDEHLPFAVRATCGGNTPCVQVSTNGREYVLLDAGTGLRDFAHHHREEAASRTRPAHAVGAKFHIFLSHFHWDHLQGLPFFYPLYAPGSEVIFYGGHDKIEEAVRAQFAQPFFPVPYEYLRAKISYRKLEPATDEVIAGLRVRICEQQHPGRSFAYRFEHDDRIFVYATDSEHKQAEVTEPGNPLVALFSDADLLVFDAMYSLEEATYSKVDWGHSSDVMGVELAARARVKRLALFHHDPHHSDADFEKILFNMRMYAELYHQEMGRRLNGGLKFPAEVLMAYDGLEVAL